MENQFFASTISIIIVLVLLLFSCEENKNNYSVQREYKNEKGIKKILKESYFDTQNRIIKEIKSDGKIVSNFDYEEINNGNRIIQLQFLLEGGKKNLLEKKVLDSLNNCISRITYYLNGDSSTSNYVLKYDKDKVVNESYYHNGSFVYSKKIDYRDGLLVKEFLTEYNCCEKNQQILFDYKEYFYNNLKQKIKECSVIDSLVKRPYKTSYHNERVCKSFYYNSDSKIIKTEENGEIRLFEYSK
jgi:hypothetical protein